MAAEIFSLPVTFLFLMMMFTFEVQRYDKYGNEQTDRDTNRPDQPSKHTR